MNRRASFIFAAALVFGIPGALQADPAGATDKTPLVFVGYTGSEALVDFPVLVRLDAAQTTTIGGPENLIFADSADALLDFDVESWTTGGEACVWVRVPSIASNTDTIYMYRLAGANAGNASGVWSANLYGLVWHLGDHIEGVWPDSTANGHVGVERLYYGAPRPATVSGVIADAVDCAGGGTIASEDGSGGRITSLELGVAGWMPKTFQCWALIPEAINKAVWDIGDLRRQIWSPNPQDGGLCPVYYGAYWGLRHSYYGDTEPSMINIPDNPPVGEWVHLVVTYNGPDFSPEPPEYDDYHHITPPNGVDNTERLYRDGQLLGEREWSQYFGVIGWGGEPGRMWLVGSFGDEGNRFFVGGWGIEGGNLKNWDSGVDEMRIERTCRSSDWIANEYLSQSDQFIGNAPVITAVADCPEYTYEGNNVLLDGANSVGASTYQWTQLAGTTVTINDAALAVANFDAPEWDGSTELTAAEASLEFELSVDGGASADTCACYVRIPGDATGDDIVNAFDLAKVRQQDPAANFNGDYVINAFDLAILRQASGRKRL